MNMVPADEPGGNWIAQLITLVSNAVSEPGWEMVDKLIVVAVVVAALYVAVKRFAG